MGTAVAHGGVIASVAGPIASPAGLGTPVRAATPLVGGGPVIDVFAAGLAALSRGHAKVTCPAGEEGAFMADGATPAGVDPPLDRPGPFADASAADAGAVDAGAAAGAGFGAVGAGSVDAVDVVDIAAPRMIEFEEFVRTETAGLLRSAYLLTGNSASAEDVVQETLTRLYPRWSRVQTAAYPKAYVHRTLVNTFLNTRRSKSSQEIVVDDIGDRPGPVDLAERVTESDLVWGLLTRLGERQRAALVLRYFHDWTDQDIARAIGCRTGTVRSLISRGLSALRTDLSADDAGYANGGRS